MFVDIQRLGTPCLSFKCVKVEKADPLGFQLWGALIKGPMWFTAVLADKPHTEPALTKGNANCSRHLDLFFSGDKIKKELIVNASSLGFVYLVTRLLMYVCYENTCAQSSGNQDFE